MRLFFILRKRILNKVAGLLRRRWEHNIELVLLEVGCGDIDWFDLAQDRGQVVGICNYCNETSGSIKYGEFLD